MMTIGYYLAATIRFPYLHRFIRAGGGDRFAIAPPCYIIYLICMTPLEHDRVWLRCRDPGREGSCYSSLPLRNQLLQGRSATNQPHSCETTQHHSASRG